MNPAFAKIMLPNSRLRLPVERLTYREIIRTLAYLNFGKCRIGVNPIPLTYIFGCGNLPMQGVQNIHPVPTPSGENHAFPFKHGWKEVHPRHTRDVLWHGVNNRGIGLAELLISTLVGVVILLGISSFYISSVRFYEQSSSQTHLQRQGTLIIDEMSRRILFASRLDQDPPTDCPATPSLKVTQPGVTGFYCFYQSSDQLLERLPDGSDFNLLDGTPRPISVSSVVFTAIGGRRVTIGFQLNDETGNSMAFATDLMARN